LDTPDLFRAFHEVRHAKADPAEWYNYDETRRERYDCGHNHKSLKAANKCMRAEVRRLGAREHEDVVQISSQVYGWVREEIGDSVEFHYRPLGVLRNGSVG
jgi:hypothetical protein